MSICEVIWQIITSYFFYKFLVLHTQYNGFTVLTKTYIITDKMIASESLQGVPLLVLANKQDLPDCMGVREVKPIFNKNAHLVGKRDCMVMPVSALTGYYHLFCNSD